MEKKKKTAQGKTCSVYHLGYTLFFKQGSQQRVGTLKTGTARKFHYIHRILYGSLGTVMSLTSAEPRNYLLRQSMNYGHFTDEETEAQKKG